MGPDRKSAWRLHGDWERDAGRFSRIAFILGLLILAGSFLLGAVESVRLWGRPPIVLDSAVLVDRLLARGDDVQATQELRMISLIMPDPPDSTERMAEGYRRLGDPAGLVRLRRAAAEREPRSAPAQAELGSALVQSGKLSAAIEAFERALELDPRLLHVYLALGNLRLKRGEGPAAEQVFRRGLRVEPFSADFSAALGEALILQGAWEDAVIEIERALQVDPGNRRALWCRDQVGQRRLAGSFEKEATR